MSLIAPDDERFQSADLTPLEAFEPAGIPDPIRFSASLGSLENTPDIPPTPDADPPHEPVPPPPLLETTLSGCHSPLATSVRTPTILPAARSIDRDTRRVKPIPIRVDSSSDSTELTRAVPRHTMGRSMRCKVSVPIVILKGEDSCPTSCDSQTASDPNTPDLPAPPLLAGSVYSVASQLQKDTLSTVSTVDLPTTSSGADASQVLALAPTLLGPSPSGTEPPSTRSRRAPTLVPIGRLSQQISHLAPSLLTTSWVMRSWLQSVVVMSAEAATSTIMSLNSVNVSTVLTRTDTGKDLADDAGRPPLGQGLPTGDMDQF